MKTANFSLPDGWTYNDYRSFLQSELSEDKPGGTEYPWLLDFDDSMMVFEDDYGSTLYQIGYSISQTDAGKDVVYDGDPVEVAEKTTYEKVAEMAAFALDGDPVEVTGEWVVRRGKVFEVGNYPDKQFSLTPQEAQAAVTAFNAVENRVQHLDKKKQPTIFDGTMGDLRAVEMADDGKTVIGTVAIPKWLEDFNNTYYGGEPFKASLEWSLDTKQIIGNTLIPNPRITDSALFGAYAAFTGGARDAPVGVKEPGMTEQVQVKAETPKAVSFTDEDVAAMRAQIAALEAKNATDTASLAKIKAERIADQAAAFADTQIKGNKAVPAQRQSLIAAFTQAAEDDDANPAVVTFAEGEAGKGGRVAALTAMFTNAPEHILTRHMTPDQIGLSTFAAAPADEANKKLYAETVEAAKKSNPKN